MPRQDATGGIYLHFKLFNIISTSHNIFMPKLIEIYLDVDQRCYVASVTN